MFDKLKIRTRLLAGYAIIVLLMVITGVYALNRLDFVANLTSELYDHPFTVRKSVRDAYFDVMKMHYLLKDAIMSPGALNASAQKINESEKDFTAKMVIVRERFLGKQEEVDHVFKAFEEWRPVRDRILTLLRAKQTAAAVNVLNNAEAEKLANLEKEVGDILAFSDTKATDFMQGAQKTAKESHTLLLLVVLAGIALAVVIGVALTRSIMAPLKMVVGVAERVAGGDLTVVVPDTGNQDELGLLMRTFQRMVGNLRTQTLAIQEGVNVLASSASEILASTTQVASGATETASAVNETTATVEEVKQTSQLASQKVRLVADGAQRSLQVSQQGRKSVDDAVQGMNRIREQMETIAESIVSLSEQGQAIGEIIATVNDLAEQSNLLAVNAAIEAAKAGEHGKGFAVVAHEVRSLAVQSKEATAQVRTILNDIQKATNAAVMATEQGSKAVEAGEKQSTEAGEAIRMLADGIAESADASTQIAASSHQQMVGMEQVAMAMENIKEASTLSVTSTRQAEQSAQNLHELGQKLKGLVEQFKL
jgi:methyl-accepting chemotaxis protein